MFQPLGVVLQLPPQTGFWHPVAQDGIKNGDEL